MTIRSAPPKFSQDDEETIYSLAEALTGSCQSGPMRKSNLLSSVARRMAACGCADLDEYLAMAEGDEQEFGQLVSALTIHTTSWFRELPHFELLRAEAERFAKVGSGDPFRVWVAACSSGEEVYSLGAMLEGVSQAFPGFRYEILASDIDPVSIGKAKRANIL